MEHHQRRERHAGVRRDGSLGAGPLAGCVGAPRPGLLAFLAAGFASSGLALPAPSAPEDGRAAFLRCCFQSALVVLELWRLCWAAGPANDEEQKSGEADFCRHPLALAEDFLFSLYGHAGLVCGIFCTFPPCFHFSAAAMRISLLVSFPLRILPGSRIQKERAGGCWLGAPKLSKAACPRIEQRGDTKRPQSPKPPLPNTGNCPPVARVRGLGQRISALQSRVSCWQRQRRDVVALSVP